MTILALDDDRVTLTALVVLPDDRIVAVGSRYNQPTNNNDGWIARFDAAGRLDPTFGQGGVVTSNIELGGGEGFNDVALLADGSFVAAGYIVPEDLDPSPQAILRRFDAHGKADAAFTNVSSGPPVVMVGGMREATGITVLPDGKLGVSGIQCPPPSGSCRAALGRFDSRSGAPDPAFGTGGIVARLFGIPGGPAQAWANGLAATSKTTLVVGEHQVGAAASDVGLMLSPVSDPAAIVTRTLAFDPKEAARAVSPTATGFVIGGTALSNNASRYFLVAVTGTGQIDAGFGPNGNGRVVVQGPGTSAGGYAVAVDAGGRILVAGDARTAADQQRMLVARHAAHGPLDAGFGGSGIATFRPEGGDARATAIGRQGSGRIIVGGWSTPGGSFKTHAVLLGLRP